MLDKSLLCGLKSNLLRNLVEKGDQGAAWPVPRWLLGGSTTAIAKPGQHLGAARWMAGGWRYLVSKRFQFYSCHVMSHGADKGIEFARLHRGKQRSGTFLYVSVCTSLVICLLQFREAWDRVAVCHESYSCGIVGGVIIQTSSQIWRLDYPPVI